MTTIRICEESEARLLIKDGSFRDYLQAWSDRFPQKMTLELVKEIKNKYKSLSLTESFLLAKSRGADEAALFEVGENVRLLKYSNKLLVFQKVGGIWVRNETGLDAFDTAELFDKVPEVWTTLCSEEDLLRGMSVEGLARNIQERLRRYKLSGLPMAFGNHEIWVWNRGYDRVNIYSQEIQYVSSYCSGEMDDIAKEIRRYRETYRMRFGSF